MQKAVLTIVDAAPVMRIESPHNQTFTTLLSLTTARGLKDQDCFLLSGEKLVREFLAEPYLDIMQEIRGPGQMSLAPAAPQVELSGALFDRLDTVGTHFNILALRQPPCPRLPAEAMAAYQPHGIELVTPTGDPGNLGALIRSCEAFGVTRVILTQEAAHPFLPKTVKASAGSVLRVPLARGPALAAFPDRCIALDPSGTPVDTFQWPADGMLLVGEEGPGFDASRFQTRIGIPTTGVESLNVVVAASIALSRLPRQA